MKAFKRIWCVLFHRRHHLIERAEGDHQTMFCAKCLDGYWTEPRR